MDEGTGGNLKEALISFFLNGFHPFTGEKLNAEHEIVPKYVLPDSDLTDLTDLTHISILGVQFQMKNCKWAYIYI